jgi:hypothetical protein
MFGLEIVVKHVSTFHEGKSCITSTFRLALRAQWTFDNHLNDTYLNYQGFGVNMPTYRFPGIDGYGSCLNLVRASLQSVVFPSPPVFNVAYTSFTFTAWIIPTSSILNWNLFCPDHAILGQHDSLVIGKSLHLAIRQRHLYFGFYYDDLIGIQTLDANVWYHVSVIQIISNLLNHCVSHRQLLFTTIQQELSLSTLMAYWTA